MTVVYCYNSKGIYVGIDDDFGQGIPANATRQAPPDPIPGLTPCWNAILDHWEMVEDHIGEEGYVNGLPYKIDDYGPYPPGWSTEPPPPEIMDQIAQIQAKYQKDISRAKDAYLSALITSNTNALEGVVSNHQEVMAAMDAEISELFT